MTLIVLTVVVIVLLVAVLAIFLFAIGTLLNRIADNLDDSAQNVKKIAYQAKDIGPGVVRINETGGTVVGALPLLCEAAERIGIAKSAPYVDASEDFYYVPYSAPAAAPAATPAAAPAAVPAATPTTVPAASPQGVGYLDSDGGGGQLGYLDK